MLFSRAKKKLGEVLVEAGSLTTEVLQAALLEHKKHDMRLGQYLLRNQHVQENQLVEALSRQLKIKRPNYQRFVPDPGLQSLLSAADAEAHVAVPLAKRGSLLLVAMQDPTDIAKIDSLSHITRHEVEAVLCVNAELRETFRAVYGRSLHLPGEDPEPALIGELSVEAGSEDFEDKDDTITITSLQNMAQDAPVIKIVNSILLQALNKRASDIHLSPKKDRMELRLRIDGDLVEYPALPKKHFLPIISRIKLISNLDISVSRVPQDGRFTFRANNYEVGVRTSTLPTIFGEKVVMRLHVQSSHNLTLDQLGMGEKEILHIEQAMLKPYGMILATGPTGSGKTTMLYSMLRKLIHPSINIITLEDPVESRIDEVTHVELNSKAGMTFASGLRSILRQDPDVIMVGEIRDQETAKIAIQASMTGHKVLSTLHTNDSSGAVTRFVEMGIEPFLISSTLLVVVAQRLVRRICPDCIEPYEAPESQMQVLIQNSMQRMHFFRGKGCFNCDNSGFKGRLGVYEVMNIDSRVQELILKRASAYTIKQALIKSGSLRTLKMDAAFKVLQGQITFEEYLTVAF